MAAVAACEFVAGFCLVALERLALSIPVGSLGLELLADGGLSGQGQRDAVTWQFPEWHFGCCLRIGGKVVGLCSFGEDQSGRGCRQQIVLDSLRWSFLEKEWNVERTKGCLHLVHGKHWG
jgi:hypothetical protein